MLVWQATKQGCSNQCKVQAMSCISQNDFPTPQYVSVSPIGAAGKAEWVHLLGRVHVPGFVSLLGVWEREVPNVFCCSLQYGGRRIVAHIFFMTFGSFRYL